MSQKIFNLASFEVKVDSIVDAKSNQSRTTPTHLHNRRKRGVTQHNVDAKIMELHMVDANSRLA